MDRAGDVVRPVNPAERYLGQPFDLRGQMTKSPKRPRDFSQAAKLVVEIATGQVEDREPTAEEQGKNPAAVELGRKGGAARAKSMAADRRAEIAAKAAASRWKSKGD
jgi:hypothetical protein